MPKENNEQTGRDDGLPAETNESDDTLVFHSGIGEGSQRELSEDASKEELRKRIGELEIENNRLRGDIRFLVAEPETESSTPYDDVYRTETTELPKLLIPLVNEAFEENYSDQASVTLSQNESFLRLSDGRLVRRITDASFGIMETLGQPVELQDKNGRIGRFIFECESKTSNNAILIRIFEYAMKKGLDQGKTLEDGRLIVNIPRCAVIFLRSSIGTDDKMEILIRTESGEASLPVHVIKVSSFTLDEIFQKRLYMLLPFYLFKYEKRFKKIEGDDTERGKLIEEFRSIRERLMNLAVGENGKENSGDPFLDTYAGKSIIEYIQRVIANLAANYPKLKEGVLTVMRGRILDYEAKRIHDDGIGIGIQQGMRRGMIFEYVTLCREFGHSESDILAGLMKRFGLERDVAEEHMGEAVGAIR